MESSMQYNSSCFNMNMNSLDINYDSMFTNDNSIMNGGLFYDSVNMMNPAGGDDIYGGDSMNMFSADIPFSSMNDQMNDYNSEIEDDISVSFAQPPAVHVEDVEVAGDIQM